MGQIYGICDIRGRCMLESCACAGPSASAARLIRGRRLFESHRLLEEMQYLYHFHI